MFLVCSPSVPSFFTLKLNNNRPPPTKPQYNITNNHHPTTIITSQPNNIPKTDRPTLRPPHDNKNPGNNSHRIRGPNMSLYQAHLIVRHSVTIVAHCSMVSTIKGLSVQVTTPTHPIQPSHLPKQNKHHHLSSGAVSAHRLFLTEKASHTNTTQNITCRTHTNTTISRLSLHPIHFEDKSPPKF